MNVAIWNVVQRNKWIGFGLLLLILLVTFQQLKFYLLMDGNLLMVAALAPFIVQLNPKQKGSFRYGLVSLAVIATYLATGLQTFFFFGVLFGLFFVAEEYIGRLNLGSFFLVFLCSPLVTYAVKVLGFDLRLKLTAWALKLLNMFGSEGNAVGNTISMNGEQFTVEPACTGIKLVIVSLLITLALIRSKERKSGAKVGFGGHTLLLSMTLLFVVISNLFRIVGLIVFEAPEGSLMHELIGVFAMFLYTVLPMIWVVKRWPLTLVRQTAINPSLVTWRTGLLQVIVVVVVLCAARSEAGETYRLETAPVPSVELTGFEKGAVDFAGMKFFNKKTLVYVKPCFNFWRSDHNPVICWKGSGYRFSEERKMQIGEHEVYVAKLQNDRDVLYTSWWFQNDSTVTTNQWAWRWDMAHGADQFALINVSCSNLSDLQVEVVKVMNELKAKSTK